MNFEVIPDEQTPNTPEIKDVNKFIEEYKDEIEGFKHYAESRKDGIGLAANQCSLGSLDGERFNHRMIAIKTLKTYECRIAIDPKIVKYHGIKRQKTEGCLTWKNKVILADRYMFVDVEFYTPDGEFHQETHKGFQGQVWQHEINHINGVEEEVHSGAFEMEVDIDKNTKRNDKCPCGSGLKYKKCCIEN